MENEQFLTPGKPVVLVHLDLSLYDEEDFRLVLGTEGAVAQAVSFGGQEYSPWAFELNGFERNTQGPSGRPSFTVSNISGLFTPLVKNNNNLIGCRLRRVRTRERFLDGQPDADPDAVIGGGADEFILNKKVAHTNKVIQWELAACTDVTGVELPKRQVVRDYCDLVYRTYTPEDGYDYSLATCPYVGSEDFNEQDEAVSAVDDKCGQRFRSCKLRFGNQPLPFGGFPGVGRVRR
jgi:lambda family phage minor tail protein L